MPSIAACVCVSVCVCVFFFPGGGGCSDLDVEDLEARRVGGARLQGRMQFTDETEHRV